MTSPEPDLYILPSGQELRLPADLSVEQRDAALREHGADLDNPLPPALRVAPDGAPFEYQLQENGDVLVTKGTQANG